MLLRIIRKCLPVLILMTVIFIASCQAESDTVQTDTMPQETKTNVKTEFETESEAPTENSEATESADTTQIITEPEQTTAVQVVHIPKPADKYMIMLDADALNKSPKLSNLEVSRQTYEGDDYLAIAVNGKDAYIQPISRKTTESGRYITVCYRTEMTASGFIHISSDDRKINTNAGQPIAYTPDGMWHTVTLDLFDNVYFGGNIIRYLRFQPTEGTDGEIDIAWIAIYPDDGAEYICKAELEEQTIDMKDIAGYEQMPSGAYVKGGDSSQKFEYSVKYAENFNRYAVKYSSDSYMTGEVTYILDGEQMSEKFYLEPGENMEFRSLTDSYFDSKYASGIVGLSFAKCTEGQATFRLLDVVADKAQVFSGGHYFLSNERYIVGVYFSQGGGISYIEDKNDGDEKLTSLVNSHDTGRLIQQSYYGVSTKEYNKATYNGSVWHYNPVQGGDQYGNESKIVDFKILDGGRKLYIKAQPMDWAQKKMICPAYMENTYTLDGDAILVNNRFVDFFGKNGKKRHQELPAFYTVSHLKNFVYYNGTKPWTGDECITLENQPFWGGNGDCYHDIVSGNTETWSAWVNENGYGIGLFVPGTETLLAGRFNYNGTKDYRGNPTNYVAPLKTFKLVSYKPFEYDYVISAGKVEEMRSVFAKYK